MRACTLLLVLIWLFHTPAFAGFAPETHRAAKTTLADSTEFNYDVKHLKFDLQMSDTSIFIAGNVTTNAQVTAATMSTYVFELDSAFTIDSAFMNGGAVTVTGIGPVRTIAIGTPLHSGDMFTARIVYHGTAPSGSGFFNGVTHGVTLSGTNVVYSVSDPYAASAWWPTKQCIDDKIDSVDMWVTVPEGVAVGSNGLLQNVSSPGPGYTQFKWKTNYAIDYYLISVSIARYAIDTSYVHFTGSSDSMLIQNFFMDTATFYPAYKSNFDSLKYMIDYYSTLFGRYPFDHEKYGVCYSTLSGGMEHQTMTTIGVTSTELIAHELTHQWFGDHVTYKYWGHVWLSEGFATYGQQLYLNHFWSTAAGTAERKSEYGQVMAAPGGSVYVTDTSGPLSLFDLRLVYYKGAAVVHMLRCLAPTDSLFFSVLRQYQTNFGFGLATTEDLKAIAESTYGFSLDTFFNQWVYGEGYPKYTVSWNQVGSTVAVKLIQTTSKPSSISLFHTPVEMQLKSPAGDTIVSVYNASDTAVYYFSWSNAMDSLVMEPNANTLLRQLGHATHDATLHVNSMLAQTIKVYPNPTNESWQVASLPANATLLLTDMNGRTVWIGKPGKSTITIPGRQLAAGNYNLTISQGNADSATIRLVHW